MAERTGIEWTDSTWNPVTGCTKISPGCAHCYAERETLRWGRGPRFLPGETEVKLHPTRLYQPRQWRKGRRIFVCSMSDLFHEDVPDYFIHSVFYIIATSPQHTFQVLTKRPERMVDRLLEYETVRRTPKNLWAGVSVENKAYKHRIDMLRGIQAPVRFLSVEPLLGPLGPLDLTGIDWVIVGGESGSGSRIVGGKKVPLARPMDPDWAREVRDQCREAGVAFFMKQMSRRQPIPDDLYIREFPA